MPSTSPDSAAARVRWDSRELEFRGGGLWREWHRRVVEIRDPETAPAAARAIVSYRTDSMHLREFRAWLVGPDGRETPIGNDEAIEVAILDETIFNEGRRRVLTPTGAVQPGSFFAWESRVEERTPFQEYGVVVSAEYPVEECTVSLRTRRDDVVRYWTRGVAPDRSSDGSGEHRWSYRRLRGDSTAGKDAAPVTELMVKVVPPETGPVPVLSSWVDVARWLAEIAESSPVDTAVIAGAAREAVRDAVSLDDSLRALADLTQSVRYVSIAMGIGSGGGYRPRPAARVLTTRYGDCKDKSNLMRALLSSLGIESHLMVLNAEASWPVPLEWPSPLHFNHCILAICANGFSYSNAVATHPRLGRLLLFDPTDEFLALGYLPAVDQGSWGLLVGPDSEPLVWTPVISADGVLVDRLVRMNVGAEGAIRGRLIETVTGIVEARYRAASRSDPATLNRNVAEALAKAEPVSVVLDGRGERESRPISPPAVGSSTCPEGCCSSRRLGSSQPSPTPQGWTSGPRPREGSGGNAWCFGRARDSPWMQSPTRSPWRVRPGNLSR